MNELFIAYLWHVFMVHSVVLDDRITANGAQDLFWQAEH